ncbi:hypothetical protein UYO_0552 [Lachnospiraceae bacterium JC7]|nr:hypothetical protein UYO_0552 [Lachnospiraceae bacterium JC7]
MRRKTKEILAYLAVAAISISQIQFPAMADEEPTKYTQDNGTIGENDDYDVNVANNVTNKGYIYSNEGKVSSNEGDINENHDTVTTNEDGGEISENSKDGSVGTNKGEIVANYGSVETNNGKIETNDSENEITGTVEENNGNITYNYGSVTTNETKGTIDENYGKVGTNKGLISENYGDVNTNKGEIIENSDDVTLNDSDGLIVTNEESVKTNNGEITTNGNDNSEASIEVNNGSVNTNRGLIEKNNGAIEISFGDITKNESNGTVEKNVGHIETNNGTVGTTENGTGNFNSINENNGTVHLNAGSDDRLSGPMDKELTEFFEDYEGAIIYTNNGTIVINNGYLETNSESGNVTTNDGIIQINEGIVYENTGNVETNKGLVAGNKGTVETNASGTVENYGTVDKNYAAVYNYGGTVKDNTKGIEYFHITIVEGKNLKRSDGDFTIYNQQEWLGQEGNTKTSTSVIITPANGFYIPEMKVPANVNAERQSDGSWILTFTSGTNISITLPDAKLLYQGGDDSDDDSGDSDSGSGNGASGNNGNNQNGNNLLTQSTLTVTDAMGNPVSIDLSTVLKPISDMTVAINSMSSMFSVAANDIKSFGTVDISALFATTSAESITVPVGAAVSAGTTYTVLLSNGEKLTVTCTENGQLNIPFTKGIGQLTFIICNEQQSAPVLPPVSEQTHNTIMGAEVSMAALSAGNDFVGAATEGLALASNVGADGVSSFAQMGGGTLRQETG